MKPAKHTALTDAAIAAAVIPEGADRRKLMDGAGLLLLLRSGKPSRWYQKLTVDGKEQMRALGDYPAMTIEAARAEGAKVKAGPKRTAASLPAPAAVAPPTNGQNAPQTDLTFGAVASAWIDSAKSLTTESRYNRRITVQKHMGALLERPIAGISEQECMAVAHAVWDAARTEEEPLKGLHVAQRTGLFMSSIFRFARRYGVKDDPAAHRKEWFERADRKALGERRRPHLLDPAAFGRMMVNVDGNPAGDFGFELGRTTSNALRFVSRIPVRVSEACGARWSEFTNLDDPGKGVLWTIPGTRMKARRQHEIPLSRQAIAILLEQREYVRTAYGKDCAYVFPAQQGDRPYTGKNLQRALKCVAFREYRSTPRGAIKSTVARGPVPHSVHGFRHTFVTMAVEAGESEPNGIADRTLGHSNKNAVAARYDLSKQLDKRRALLQWWADRVDALIAEHSWLSN